MSLAHVFRVPTKQYVIRKKSDLLQRSSSHAVACTMDSEDIFANIVLDLAWIYEWI